MLKLPKNKILDIFLLLILYFGVLLNICTLSMSKSSISTLLKLQLLRLA
ncbi:exported hypothetical protein [Vibrio nigripulchritudo AM115]|nr:exported hypothetical protein [Vibrio nigripulchritudo AM115]